MKLKLLGLAVGLACTFSVSAETNLNALSKELSIMQTVIEKGLETNQENGVRVRQVSGRYLANQGVIFEIDTNLKRQSVFNVTRELSHADQISVDSDKLNLEFIEQGLGSIISDALELAGEAIENSTIAGRNEIAHKRNELAWKRRELLRSKRDIEYERRLADEGNEQDFLNHIKEIELELEQVSAHEEALEQAETELKTEREQKRKIKRETLKQAQSSFLTFFEQEMTSLLCSFGGGLSSLAKSDYVNFVLPKFESEGDKIKDKIYVFKYSDIASCNKSKNGAESLLKSAQIYSF